MRLIGLNLLAIGICLVTALPRHAQKQTKSPLPTTSDKQSSPLHPAPAIQTLTKALAGSWSTRETYEPIYLTPNGGTGNGEQVFRTGPGGFTLLEDYHSKTPSGELFGFGVLWWDQTRGLQHMWCINVSPTGCEMFPAPPQPGPQWDGQQLIIHIEGEQEGKKVVWHEVISDITPESFTQTADIGESGSHLSRWFTIHAVRKAGSTHTSNSSGSHHP
jgi:hypothetical protein